MSEQQDLEILLIEDRAADVELTLHALHKERLANNIQVVKDGEEALDFLFARAAHAGRSLATPPKLILLDLKLPKVDGLEVLRQIKSDEHLRMIPVVMLTSSREEQDVVDSYKLGVNAYVVKPIDFKDFLSAVKEIGLFWAVINEPPPVG
jgi:CheY-like chemotaxis protein